MAGTRKTRVPMVEQIRLINECRQSGMTDADWCRENDIAVSTFYNWVSRLRKKACCEIPESISKAEPLPAPVQEVVRLNFNSKAGNPESMLLCQPALTGPTRIADITARIEISLGNATIRIANGTDPALLDRVLSLVKGSVC